MRQFNFFCVAIKMPKIFFYIFMIFLFISSDVRSQAIYPNPYSSAAPNSIMRIGIAPGIFSINAADNIVYFGGVRANVLSATASELSVAVPHGSFYSLISVNTNGFTYYSWAPFITAFTNNAVPSLTVNSFDAKIDSAAGSGAGAIASGDLNGDGKADIVVVNSSANTVSILKNTGMPGVVAFAPKTEVATSTAPNHAVVADIDGDGKLDMVVINSSANTVSVFRNTTTTSTITFAPKQDFITGNAPYKCTVNDFDLDGRLDIAVVNRSGDNSVSVLRNTSMQTGLISFAPKVDYPTGNFPIDIISDDMNQDSKPELAVVNYFSNTLSIFKNGSVPGSIFFQQKVDYPTGAFPVSVACGYILNDFKREIAVANFVDNSVSVFSHGGNNNEPTFNAKVDFASGTGPVALTLNDIDGNGYADIIIANQSANTVSVLRNTINPNLVIPAFAAQLEYGVATMPNAVISADFDNDGKPDIATANFNSNNISVLRNKAGDSATDRSITVCPNGTATLQAGISGTSFAWQFSTDGINFSEISSNDQGFSGVNTSTLTIPVTYTFFYGWQFRCVVNGYNDKPVTVKLAETWNGAVDNHWENTANWNCGVIPDGNTDVIINNVPVIINSNAQSRSIKVNPGVSVTVNSGFNLQVTH
jgi:hypothetical protein